MQRAHFLLQLVGEHRQKPQRFQPGDASPAARDGAGGRRFQFNLVAKRHIGVFARRNGVVHSAQHDRVLLGFVLVDGARGHVQRLGALDGHRVEHVFDARRGRHGPDSVQQRRQLAGPLLLLAIKARVVDGHGGWE